VALAEVDGTSVAYWEVELMSGMDTNWFFEFADGHGIKSVRDDAVIRAEMDRAPTVTIDSPLESEFELRPTEKLPLEYTVREDFGVASVTLQLLPQGKPEKKVVVTPLPTRVSPEVAEWGGAAVLDLAAHDLEGVNEMVVALIAADGLPVERKGPQTGRSRELKIRIRRDAKSLMEQTVAAQAEEIRKEMEEVKKELTAARQEMANKPDMLRNDPQIQPQVLKEIESSEAHAEKASEMLNQLAERMKETAYARQAPDLERIAKELVDPAAENAQEIPLRDDQKERAELAQEANQQLEKAIQQLDQEHQQNAQEQQQAQQIAQLQALADEQARLAREAAEAKQASAERAATEALEIAAEAKALSGVQEALKAQAAQADTPQKQQELAQAEQKLTEAGQKLEAKAKEFAQRNAGELAQDAAENQMAAQGVQNLQDALQDARETAEQAQQASQQNQQPPNQRRQRLMLSRCARQWPNTPQTWPKSSRPR
jgi:hypothetical protein